MQKSAIPPPHQIENLADFHKRVQERSSLSGCVLQSLNLSTQSQTLKNIDVEDAVFLGCTLEDQAEQSLSARGALVFPTLDALPFNAYRASLYRAEDLFEGFDPKAPESYEHTLDARVYKHYLKLGKQSQSITETLARSLHDHAMSDAKSAFIEGKHLVAIMGGHAISRDDKSYAQVARIARALTREGILITTGGGPGAMEAGHLGAWMASYDDDALSVALEMLSHAPHYTPVGEWLAAAYKVRERFANPTFESLGIPTWLYGHEPPTAFATHIAKYFANAIREDGLLEIAKGGVIFSPGSAGTIQEIFQDATQNHYNTTGVVSPMVFLGVEYWTRTKPVYPLLFGLAEGREYQKLMSISDEESKIVDALLAFRDKQH